MPPPHMSPDDHGDGRSKAKRELSQSKRAAQNRAAQVSKEYWLVAKQDCFAAC